MKLRILKGSQKDKIIDVEERHAKGLLKRKLAEIFKEKELKADMETKELKRTKKK